MLEITYRKNGKWKRIKGKIPCFLFMERISSKIQRIVLDEEYGFIKFKDFLFEDDFRISVDAKCIHLSNEEDSELIEIGDDIPPVDIEFENCRFKGVNVNIQGFRRVTFNRVNADKYSECKVKNCGEVKLKNGDSQKDRMEYYFDQVSKIVLLDGNYDGCNFRIPGLPNVFLKNAYVEHRGQNLFVRSLSCENSTLDIYYLQKQHTPILRLVDSEVIANNFELADHVVSENSRIVCQELSLPCGDIISDEAIILEDGMDEKLLLIQEQMRFLNVLKGIVTRVENLSDEIIESYEEVSERRIEAFKFQEQEKFEKIEENVTHQFQTNAIQKILK